MTAGLFYLHQRTLLKISANVDSLIQHSPTMSHFDMTPEERYASEIYDGQVRLSIGIEDADDLIADLDQALALI